MTDISTIYVAAGQDITWSSGLGVGLMFFGFFAGFALFVWVLMKYS